MWDLIESTMRPLPINDTVSYVAQGPGSRKGGDTAAKVRIEARCRDAYAVQWTSHERRKSKSLNQSRWDPHKIQEVVSTAARYKSLRCST